MFKSIKEWFSPPTWDPNKAKVHLKLAISRLKLQITKKQNGEQLARREVAQLLKEGKEIPARLRVESMIKDEKMVAAHEQLIIICEHILARFDALNLTSHPPPDLQGSICSVIFAAPRVDIVEFRQLVENFTLKYGKEFVDDALANRYNTVNEKVVENLSMQRPPRTVVNKYLKQIAEANGIKWEISDDEEPVENTDEDWSKQAPPAPAFDVTNNDVDDLLLQEEALDELDFIPTPNFGPQPQPNFGLPSDKPISTTTNQASQINPNVSMMRSQNIHTSSLDSRRVTGSVHSKAPRAPAAPATTNRGSNKALSQSDDDALFLELDLPTVPTTDPRKGFGGNDEGGDLLNLLPEVPPSKPHVSSTSGHHLSSSEAVLQRPKPSHSTPPTLDDDDLMRRFNALKDAR